MSGRVELSLRLFREALDRRKINLPGRTRALPGSEWCASPIVHVCYHKCLTWFFTRMFEWCSDRFDVPLFVDGQHQVDHSGRAIFMNTQGVAPLLDDTAFRGSHVIRDPRDLVVSAYFYHLRTEEAWCVHPTPENHDLPGDVSYQEHLRSLDSEDGLIFEMNHVSGSMIERMCSWNYADDRFLELRFEDVAGNEVDTIEKLLAWYGLSAKDAHAVSRALEFLSLERVKAAAKSRPDRDRHIGTGNPLGKWQRYFTHRVQSAFDERFPDALDVLGYV